MIHQCLSDYWGDANERGQHAGNNWWQTGMVQQPFVADCNVNSEQATLFLFFLTFFGSSCKWEKLVTYCIFLCLWSFQHLCQSSHGTQITQKNVSYDDNVNKDKPGNGYTTMSSVKHMLFIVELGGESPQVKQRWSRTPFYIASPSRPCWRRM